MPSRLVIVCWLVVVGFVPTGAGASEVAKPAALVLDQPTQGRCLEILRAGLKSDEFWPAMHAAEALTLAGHSAEVRENILARIPQESDDQKRCGLARELVRAGDLSHTQTLLDILASPDPHGHTHACESLFKVWQIGDGRLLRGALERIEQPKTALMAAAALTRWGHPEALKLIRQYAADDDTATAAIAAWILARVGDASDVPVLQRGVARCEDPLQKAYFEHALAALGDAGGLAALIRNLGDANPAVRVYACEFAPEARALGGEAALRKLLDDEVLDIRIRAAQALLQLAQPVDPHAAAPFTNDRFVASVAHPRYSEGSVVTLRDGRLLYATTQFIAEESDFAPARIVAVESADEGRTWSAPRVLQENVGRTNVMSVTLRRLSNDPAFSAPLGCFFLRKNSFQDLQVWLRRSTDEGASWEPAIRVTADAGYHVLNNDRVTLLSTGRLVVPIASSVDVNAGQPFTCSCVLSDDGGLTWKRSGNQVSYAKRGAMEPEVLELADGRLLMHFRTQLGHIAVSESTDAGETWGPARSWEVRSPEAPATLRRLPATGDLLLIWNDVYLPGAGHGGPRTPLTLAISSDEGRTWRHNQQLETNLDQTYAYTSVLFHRGRVILTYYVRDEASGRISSRFRSLPLPLLYAAGDD